MGSIRNISRQQEEVEVVGKMVSMEMSQKDCLQGSKS